MDQTLNRITESLALLLDQGDGRGRLRPRLGQTGNVLPSQDSLPSYDQLSSSPSSLSSNAVSVAHHPNPPPDITACQDESSWTLSSIHLSLVGIIIFMWNISGIYVKKK